MKCKKPAAANLDHMLGRLVAVEGEEGRVSVEKMISIIGRRSFGPLLLFAGLVVLSPLSGIPGLPTATACVICLIVVQLLMRRDYFWLPRWITRCSLPQDQFRKAIGWLRPPARWVDRLVRPRWQCLTENAAVGVIGVICLGIALGMPFLEMVPFSATAAGAAISIFGLALIAGDGVLCLLALFLITLLGGLVFCAVL